MRQGERFETSGDVVDARTTYVAALFAPPSPSVGAMWRLGDLARREGHPVEGLPVPRRFLSGEHIVALGAEEQNEEIVPLVN